jgi:hypothetical protein
VLALPADGIADVFSAVVLVIARAREATLAILEYALVVGAIKTVVAHDASAEVLSAHPLDADPTRTAGCTIVRQRMLARLLVVVAPRKIIKKTGWWWLGAPIAGARVAVVAVHIPDAVLLPARRDAQGAKP